MISVRRLVHRDALVNVFFVVSVSSAAFCRPHCTAALQLGRLPPFRWARRAACCCRRGVVQPKYSQFESFVFGSIDQDFLLTVECHRGRMTYIFTASIRGTWLSKILWLKFGFLIISDELVLFTLNFADLRDMAHKLP